MFKAIALAGLMLTLASNAFAQNPRNAVVEAQRAGPTRPSKSVTRVHQPTGKPSKASGLAPRPTNKRVFGAPIQAPIVHKAPEPK